jgi:hypothetical protein
MFVQLGRQIARGAESDKPESGTSSSDGTIRRIGIVEPLAACGRRLLGRIIRGVCESTGRLRTWIEGISDLVFFALWQKFHRENESSHNKTNGIRDDDGPFAFHNTVD